MTMQDIAQRIKSAFSTEKAERITGLTQLGLADMLRATATASSGVAVTEETALRLSAVWSCIVVISESYASLPLHLMRQRDRQREKATDHPLYWMLHDQPNEWQTSFEYRQQQMYNLLTTGNHYSFIDMRRDGVINRLLPLDPARMDVKYENGALKYRYSDPEAGQFEFPMGLIHHIRGMSKDGIVGLSPLAAARESIGVGSAAQQFVGKFYANGAWAGGYYELPVNMNNDARSNFLSYYETRHGGFVNAFKPGVVPPGVKWQQTSLPLKDVEFLETRKFTRSEIASIFRVPLHFIGDLDRATYSNIEHQSIEFVMYTLRPWCIRSEQAMGRDLLSARERAFGLRFNFALDGLLRGDYKTRQEGLAIQRQNGVLTGNEWREFEERNPIEGGDELLINGNMIPLSRATEGPEDDTPDMPEEPSGETPQQEQEDERVQASV